MRAGLALVLLVAVYALTLASAHPLDLVAGGVFGACVLAGFRRFLFTPPGPSRPSLPRRVLAFPRFALAVAWDVMRGTWQVTLVVTGLRRASRSGVVHVPIGERSPRGVAVSALALTLAPGECLIDVDWERGTMLVHALDADDPEAVRSQLARFYERYQRAVFP